jgi:DNA-binding transcriptional MerR regulator
MGTLFSYGDNTSANACVGTNGNGQTYWNYADGFYLAYKNIYDYLRHNYYCEIDTLIFPLIYNARHAVELYMKKLIYDLIELRTPVAIPNKVKLTHSLITIFGYLEGLLAQDQRFLEENISTAKSLVTELDGFDLTGATFRYPETKDGNIHLENVSIINVDVFNDGFESLISILEEWAFVGSFLLEEYDLGTYTQRFSRENIRDFAKEIRVYGESGFTIKEIEAIIRKKHNMSSQEWNQVVKIIEGNREFSYIVGEYKDLKYATVKNIAKALNYNSIYNSKISTRHYSIKFAKNNYLIARTKNLDEMVLSMLRLSGRALADICAVYRMGHRYTQKVYSEFYESFLKREIENSKYTLATEIVTSRNFIELFYRGLQIVGATHMLDGEVFYEKVS